MVGKRRSGEQRQLTAAALDEVRDAWGFGCPLRVLAARYGLSEVELREQLRQHRRTDRPAEVQRLRQLIQARQRAAGGSHEEGGGDG